MNSTVLSTTKPHDIGNGKFFAVVYTSNHKLILSFPRKILAENSLDNRPTIIDEFNGKK